MTSPTSLDLTLFQRILRTVRLPHSRELGKAAVDHAALGGRVFVVGFGNDSHHPSVLFTSSTWPRLKPRAPESGGGHDNDFTLLLLAFVRVRVRTARDR
jgi:hypothetical protein